jgi:hypothetical protein
MYELVLKTNRIIDVGERNIVMATKDYGRGKPRFVVNLPTTRNDLWVYLWDRKIPVKVFIEIPSEGLNRGEQGEVKQQRRSKKGEGKRQKSVKKGEGKQ